MEGGVGDVDLAGAASRAHPVHLGQHIGPAPDLVVGREALPLFHATVSCSLHDHHLAGTTRLVEDLGETVLPKLCNRQRMLFYRWASSKINRINGTKQC